MSKTLERKKICDGVFLNSVASDKHKTNYLSFYFFSELTKTSATYCSLISQMLSRGTEKYPSARLFNRALDEQYGADVEVSTLKLGESLGLCVTLSVLADRFSLEKGVSIMENALDIVTEMIFRPYTVDGGFEEKALSGEKKNLKDAIEAQINNKSEYSKRQLITHMCADEAFSVSTIGYADIADKVSGRELYEFYKQFLKESHVEICFAGECDGDKLIGKLKSAFSETAREPKALTPAVIIKDIEDIKTVKDQMDITQSHLLMGYRTGVTGRDDDFCALSLYNALLGGSITGKLFMNVREKKSLCYTVSSAIFSDKGIMRIYAGVNRDKCSFAIAEIEHQIRQIEKGKITEDELREAKLSLTSALRALPDSPNALAAWYIRHIMNGRTDRTPEGVADAIDALTREDVMRIASGITFDTLYILEGVGEETEEEEYGENEE